MPRQKENSLQKLSKPKNKLLKKQTKPIQQTNKIAKRRKRRRVYTQQSEKNQKESSILKLLQPIKKKYQQIKNYQCKFVKIVKKDESKIQLILPEFHQKLKHICLRRSRNLFIFRKIKSEILKQPKEQKRPTSTQLQAQQQHNIIQTNQQISTSNRHQKNIQKQKNKKHGKVADENFINYYLKKQLQKLLNGKIQQCTLKQLQNLNQESLFQQIIEKYQNDCQIPNDIVHILDMMRRIQCRAVLANSYIKLIKKVYKISRDPLSYYYQSQQQQQSRIIMKIKQVFQADEQPLQDRIQKLVTIYEQYLIFLIQKMKNQEILINKQIKSQLQNIQKQIINQVYLFEYVNFYEEDIGKSNRNPQAYSYIT